MKNAGELMTDKNYKKYLLILLLVILASNALDRLALGLLLQDIKTDLGLTDTQLGLLTGIAFALFYSVMGIPIARWADRGNRALIIAVTTGLWSVAVAVCGLANNFTQLLLVRIGVAVGEAGCMPPAHSLIADYFRRDERPRALSIYLLGAPLSSVVGYFMAGWLNERYGWRTTFIFLGLPGVLLSILVACTLREPRTKAIPQSNQTCGDNPSSPGAVPGLTQVCLSLWSNITFRHLLIGSAGMSFFGTGIAKWLPSFFIRSYHLQTGELGAWFGVAVGLTGLGGTFLGGMLASRFAPNSEGRQLIAVARLYPLVGIAWSLIFLSSNKIVAFSFIGVASIGVTLANAPVYATIQSLVPDRMRATSVALMSLFSNLVGMGLGPLVVGMLSDRFRPWAGDESLRYGLLTFCPGYLWIGWHFWKASRTVAFDLGKTEGVVV